MNVFQAPVSRSRWCCFIMCLFRLKGWPNLSCLSSPWSCARRYLVRVSFFWAPGSLMVMCASRRRLVYRQSLLQSQVSARSVSTLRLRAPSRRVPYRASHGWPESPRLSDKALLPLLCLCHPRGLTPHRASEAQQQRCLLPTAPPASVGRNISSTPHIPTQPAIMSRQPGNTDPPSGLEKSLKFAYWGTQLHIVRSWLPSPIERKEPTARHTEKESA